MILRNFARRQARSALGSFRFAAPQARFLSNDLNAPPPMPVYTAEGENDALGSTVASETEAFPPAPELPQQELITKLNPRHDHSSTGSRVSEVYRPEYIIKNPPSASDITFELLLASQTHLGHSTSLWNPRNSGYIFGIRQGVHIISLEVTAAHLRRAAKIVQGVAHSGGLILFVGTRKKQARFVVRASELAGGYHIFDRWRPGTLTNGDQLLTGCDLKVVSELDEELPEYAHKVEGNPPLRPDLVVCFNPLENEPLLKECANLVIPTIGVIDTDADASKVTYPIPANDDSLRSIGLIAGVLGRAGEAGQRDRLAQSKTGRLPYDRVTFEDEART